MKYCQARRRPRREREGGEEQDRETERKEETGDRIKTEGERKRRATIYPLADPSLKEEGGAIEKFRYLAIRSEEARINQAALRAPNGCEIGVARRIAREKRTMERIPGSEVEEARSG